MDGTHEQIQLRDGTSLRIRPPRPEDAEAMLAFLSSLSDSPRLNFVSRVPDLEAMARWAASPDGSDHLGILALDAEGKLVGHVACVRIYGRRAEVAVDVDDGQRYHGLASALLRRMTADARRQGMHTLIAEVVPEPDDASFVPNGSPSTTGANSWPG